MTAGAQHTCGVTTKGVVICWGNGANGRLGYASSSDVSAPGAAVNLGGPATSLALGAAHTCAIIRGNVRCWGRHDRGALGTPLTEDIGDGEVPSVVEFVSIFD